MQPQDVSLYLVLVVFGCVGLCLGRCIGGRCLSSQSRALRQENKLLLPKIGSGGGPVNVKIFDAV